MKHLVLSCLFALVFGTSLFAGPSNDNRSNAIALPNANIITKSGTNFNASRESFELTGQSYASVWYRWVAPRTAKTTIDVLAYYDSTLIVYTRDDTGYTFIQYDDDSGDGLNSRIQLDAVAGTIYYFAVDGWSARQGVFTLNLVQEGTVSDTFAGRTEFIGTSFTAVGNNSAFTAETGEPDHGEATRVSHKTAWVTWTPTVRSSVTLTTEGSRFDTIIAVYTGDAVDALTLVAKDDNAGIGTNKLLSRVQFIANPGQSYHFAVDGALGAGGTFNLNLSSSPVPPGLIMPSRDLTIWQGDQGSVTVSVQSSDTPTFQWQRQLAGTKAWVPISEDDFQFKGALTDTLTIVGATLSMNKDSFRVLVTDTVGTSTSAIIKLTVTEFQQVQTEVLGQIDYRELAFSSVPPPTAVGAIPGTYFAVGLPKGLTIDPLTGIISGTITAKPGIYRVTYGTTTGKKRNPLQFILEFNVAAFSPSLVGRYEALLEKVTGNAVPEGKVTLTVSAVGGYTGTYYSITDAKTYPFRGTLVLDQANRTAGTAIGVPIQIKRAKNLTPHTLTFTLTEPDTSLPDVYATLRVTVLDSVNDVVGTTTSGVKLAVFTAASPAPWTGSYTAHFTNMLDAADTPAPLLPTGLGFATATVTAKTGALAFKGRLAEGTIFTANLASSNAAQYHLAQRVHAGVGGSIAGWMQLIPRAAENEVVRYYSPIGNSELFWVKPADKNYPAGFGPLSTLLHMEPWVNPAGDFVTALRISSRGVFILNLVSDTVNNDALGALTNFYNLPIKVSLLASGRISITEPAPDTSKFTFKADAVTGAFSGSFQIQDAVVPPAIKLPRPRTVTFAGAFLQQQDVFVSDVIGQGYFLIPPKSPETKTSSGLIQFIADEPGDYFGKTDDTVIE